MFYWNVRFGVTSFSSFVLNSGYNRNVYEPLWVERTLQLHQFLLIGRIKEADSFDLS